MSHLRETFGGDKVPSPLCGGGLGRGGTAPKNRCRSERISSREERLMPPPPSPLPRGEGETKVSLSEFWVKLRFFGGGIQSLPPKIGRRPVYSSLRASAFISRTALSIPTKTAWLTMLCPVWRA